MPAQRLIHIHPGAEELGRVYHADLMINATMLGLTPREARNRFDRVIDFDPATGTARLKKNIDRASEIALDVGSVRTVRTKRDPNG